MNNEIKILPETPTRNYQDTVSQNNSDVLIEILLWLPAKSLTRFKLVCKNWFYIISSDHFSRLHTLRHPKSEPSLIIRALSSSQFFYFHPILNGGKLIPYHFSVPNAKVLSSCKGLLLLESDHPQNSYYYVYNPTTKKSRHIALRNSDIHTDVLGLNLVFDPSNSPHYKIVCIRLVKKSSTMDGRCCQIEVYDSENHTWKLCVESFTRYIQTDFSSGVLWNNTIHWANHPRAHLYFDIGKIVVGNLPYIQIPWPEGGGGGACYCQLQEAKGHLHSFVIVSDHGDKSIAVFELQADYTQWALKYHDKFGRLPGGTRILCFVRGDSIETDTLVYHVPGKIIGYKFIDKSFKELVDLRNEAFYQEDAVQFEPRNVHQFGETLAPV